MRLFTSTIAFVVSTMALGACGSGNVQQTIEDPESGEKVSVSTNLAGAGIALPDNLPAFAAAYPGAKVGTVVSKPGASSEGLISLTVKAQPQAVIDHYRKQGEAAGLKVVTEMATGEARMLAMGKEGSGGSEGASPAMQITTSPSGEDGGSIQVTVTYSAGTS